VLYPAYRNTVVIYSRRIGIVVILCEFRRRSVALWIWVRIAVLSLESVLSSYFIVLWIIERGIALLFEIGVSHGL